MKIYQIVIIFISLLLSGCWHPMDLSPPAHVPQVDSQFEFANHKSDVAISKHD